MSPEQPRHESHPRPATNRFNRQSIIIDRKPALARTMPCHLGPPPSSQASKKATPRTARRPQGQRMMACIGLLCDRTWETIGLAASGGWPAPDWSVVGEWWSRIKIVRFPVPHANDRFLFAVFCFRCGSSLRRSSLAASTGFVLMRLESWTRLALDVPPSCAHSPCRTCRP